MQHCEKENKRRCTQWQQFVKNDPALSASHSRCSTWFNLFCFFAGTGRFLAGLCSFLSWWPIVNWLRLWKKKKVGVFCTVFHDIMLRCEMWSVPHTNEFSIQFKNFNHSTRGNFVVVMAGSWKKHKIKRTIQQTKESYFNHSIVVNIKQLWLHHKIVMNGE